MRTFAGIALVCLLAVTQTAQGVFAGMTLCREENGSVSLEWANDGRCAASAHERDACLKREAADTHCGTCLDAPFTSETAGVSALVLSFVAAPVPWAARLFVPTVRPAPTPSSGPASASGAVFDGARTVRLLI